MPGPAPRVTRTLPGRDMNVCTQGISKEHVAPPRPSPSNSALAFSRASFERRRPSGRRTSLQLRKGFECDGVRTIALPHRIIWALS